MIQKDEKLYVKSELPWKEHKYHGWFFYYPTKKFYRYNDIPYHIKEENGNS